MDQRPLVGDEVRAGEELLRRLKEVLPVKSAFWVKATEEEPWYLYISSDQIESPGVESGYREVARVVSEMHDPFLDRFSVNVVPTTHPFAQAAINLQTRFARLMPTRLGATPFGEGMVEGVFLYPAPTKAMTGTEL